jgi:hypothetical protein
LWLLEARRQLVGGCRTLQRPVVALGGVLDAAETLLLRLEALGRGDDACRGSCGVATTCWRLSTLAEALVALQRLLWRCDDLLEAVDACRGSGGVATACWRLSTLWCFVWRLSEEGTRLKRGAIDGL